MCECGASGGEGRWSSLFTKKKIKTPKQMATSLERVQQVEQLQETQARREGSFWFKMPLLVLGRDGTIVPYANAAAASEALGCSAFHVARSACLQEPLTKNGQWHVRVDRTALEPLGLALRGNTLTRNINQDMHLSHKRILE